MKNFSLFLLLTVLVLSCKNEKNFPDSFDYGKVENSVYVNDYFDMKIPFPEEWNVVEGEQLKRLQEVGEEFATGDNDQLKEIIKASEINNAQLLSLFRYEVGADVGFNHNVQVVVENLNTIPDITTGKEYLFQAKHLLTSSAMDIEIVQDTQTLDIGGRNIDGLIVTNTVSGKVIQQVYLAQVKNGFCINFILSYINNEQRDELYKIIGEMQL